MFGSGSCGGDATDFRPLDLLSCSARECLRKVLPSLPYALLLHRHERCEGKRWWHRSVPHLQASRISQLTSSLPELVPHFRSFRQLHHTTSDSRRRSLCRCSLERPMTPPMTYRGRAGTGSATLVECGMWPSLLCAYEGPVRHVPPCDSMSREPGIDGRVCKPRLPLSGSVYESGCILHSYTPTSSCAFNLPALHLHSCTPTPNYTMTAYDTLYCPCCGGETNTVNTAGEGQNCRDCESSLLPSQSALCSPLLNILPPAPLELSAQLTYRLAQDALRAVQVPSLRRLRQGRRDAYRRHPRRAPLRRL